MIDEQIYILIQYIYGIASLAAGVMINYSIDRQRFYLPVCRPEATREEKRATEIY